MKVTATEQAQIKQKFADLFPVSEGEHPGVMVAFYLPATVAQQLAAIPGVQTPADQLHITLAYCGRADDLADTQIAGAIVAAQAMCRYQEPLKGTINGVGRFNASTNTDGKDVVYAVVDIPGLDQFRNSLLSYLRDRGCTVSDAHGFNPHVTLAYIDAGSESPIAAIPTMPLHLDAISVSVGGRVAHLPFIPVSQVYSGDLADLCANGKGWRLFNEYAFATPPEWAPCLPAPGTFQHPSYGEIAITADRNANFVQNFKAGVYQSQIPVDAEHELKVSGAVGWITDLRQNSDGSVDAKVDWTERGQSLIEADSYKYVSPEWYDAWTAPDTGVTHNDVLVGLALTTRPFFKEKALRPLVASERGLFATDEPVTATATTVVYLNPFVTKESNSMADNTKTVAQDPAPAQVTAQQFSEMQKSFAELTNRLAAAESLQAEAENKAKQYAEALDKSNERVAALEAAAQRKRFGELSGGWFGKPEDNVNLLVKLSHAFGEESAEFAAYVTQQRAVAEQMKQSNLFTEIGTTVTTSPQTAKQKMEAEINRVAAERKIGYADAATAVAGEQPQLYREYLAEVRGK